MGRHAKTLPKLDQAHAALREHPGITAEEFGKYLPKVECWCEAGSGKYATRKLAGECWACEGTGLRAPERQVAYTMLRKLAEDGRARIESNAYTPYRWHAIVDEETAALDAWFEELGDQAPDDPAEEWHRLDGERTAALAAADEAQARMDALVNEMLEADDRPTGTYKALAERLGIQASKVSNAQHRHWRRQREALDAEAGED